MGEPNLIMDFHHVSSEIWFYFNRAMLMELLIDALLYTQLTISFILELLIPYYAIGFRLNKLH